MTKPRALSDTPLPPPTLEELSTAAARYSRHTDKTDTKTAPARTRPIVAAIIISVATVVIGRLEYHSIATFQLPDYSSTETVSDYRRELLDFSWERLSTDPSTSRPSWSVSVGSGGVLFLGISAPGRYACLETTRSLGEGFVAHVAQKSAVARTTPGEGEVVLGDYLSELKTRLDDAQTQAQSHASPEADDPNTHETLLDYWTDQRSKFDVARKELAEASAALRDYRNQPEPTHGIVTFEIRQRALENDATLQQDLKELTVRLSELKLHLLSVWQESAPLLETSKLACDDFARAISDGASILKNLGPALDEPAQAISDYHERLGEFAQSWNGEFLTLRQLEIDPLSGELLDIHQRARSALSAYLFHASKAVTILRARVATFGDTAGNNAKHYVFHSNLTRRFHALQSAHQRFEFAAGTIETGDNFRLDASLKSARGLHRRSRDRIRRIDQQLGKHAVAQARKDRASTLKAAAQALADARQRAEGAVDELVLLQDKLNISAGLTETFLRNVLQAELSAQGVELTRAHVGSTQQRIDKLKTQRTTSADATGIALVSCTGSTWPVNLHRRVGLALMLGLVTFMCVSAVERRLVK